MNRILWQRTLTQLRGQLADGSDSELLERFVNQQDSEAFGLLLQRHGPLVWGVCRRILHVEADAEDAFQATFMVLVRKAGQLRDRRALANWLYGVAHTTALKARSMAGKRQAKEQHAAQPEGTETTAPDWLPLLDDELNRLPANYRTVLILCDLEGQSHKEAAEQLQCPMGTISARLARGRRMLAERLRRRGVTLSVAALTATLTQHAMQALVPSSLIALTQDAARTGTPSVAVANLTDKVIQAMFIKKILTLTLVAVTMVAATCGFLPSHAPVQAQTPAIVEENQRALNLKRLEGTWIPEQLVTANGVTNYPLRGRALHFERGVFVRMEGNQAVAIGRYELTDGFLKLGIEDHKPWDLEAGISKKNTQYSFNVEGDLLTLCYAVDGKVKASDLTPGEGRQVTVYKRQTDISTKPISRGSLAPTPTRPAPSLGSVGMPTTTAPAPLGLPTVKPESPALTPPSSRSPLTPGLPPPASTPGLAPTDPFGPAAGGGAIVDPDRARLDKLEQELLELRKKIDAELAKTKGGK